MRPETINIFMRVLESFPFFIFSLDQIIEEIVFLLFRRDGDWVNFNYLRLLALAEIIELIKIALPFLNNFRISKFVRIFRQN